MTDLLPAAKALLARIDNLTTDEFQHGGERKERERLRLAIAEAEMPKGTLIKMLDHDRVYEVDRVYLRDADPYVLAYYQNTPDQRVGLDQPFSAIEKVLPATPRNEIALMAAEATLSMCWGKVPTYCKDRCAETLTIVRDALKRGD